MIQHYEFCYQFAYLSPPQDADARRKKGLTYLFFKCYIYIYTCRTFSVKKKSLELFISNKWWKWCRSTSFPEFLVLFWKYNVIFCCKVYRQRFGMLFRLIDTGRATGKTGKGGIQTKDKEKEWGQKKKLLIEYILNMHRPCSAYILVLVCMWLLCANEDAYVYVCVYNLACLWI